jgi:hypothetical protein
VTEPQAGYGTSIPRVGGQAALVVGFVSLLGVLAFRTRLGILGVSVSASLGHQDYVVETLKFVLSTVEYFVRQWAPLFAVLLLIELALYRRFRADRPAWIRPPIWAPWAVCVVLLVAGLAVLWMIESVYLAPIEAVVNDPAAKAWPSEDDYHPVVACTAATAGLLHTARRWLRWPPANALLIWIGLMLAFELLLMPVDFAVMVRRNYPCATLTTAAESGIPDQVGEIILETEKQIVVKTANKISTLPREKISRIDVVLGGTMTGNACGAK